MKIAEVLKKNGVEVVVTDHAVREVERFRKAHVSTALSADERSGVIFLGGHEERKRAGLAEHHVIVLRAEDVRSDVISAYNLARERSDVIFASSSPSKTADIEGKLVFGMHGPRRVTVILEVKK